MINIQFKKDLIQKFSKGINILEIIQQNKMTFSQKPIAAYFNNKLIGLRTKLEKDGFLEVITSDRQESLKILNYNTTLLMAQAIQRIYPNALLVKGLCHKDGFYYEVDFQNINFSHNDLPNIEKVMHQIVEEKLDIIPKNIIYKGAYEQFAFNKYKLKILQKMKDKEFINICSCQNFEDLNFDNVLLTNTNIMKHFKLLKISGSYFEGNIKNSVLTRIYGVSFFNKKDLKQYLDLLKDREQRDHKNINKEQNLFMLSSEVGLGLPFWLPKGATIRRIIERYITDKELSYDYQHVYTPILANTKLYQTSGHLELYKENMFPIMELPNEEKLVLRPMNCPHHMMIFKKQLRSYKDLPIKIAELGMMHRYEHSGAVSGLQRTREMTLNDAHIFIHEEQIKEQITQIIQFILEVYKDFEITKYNFNLSTRDILNKDKYFDNDLIWDKSETFLREILKENNISYKEVPGDAAFYGPKLDIQVLTALENEETLSTIQLDFLLPQKFNLKYIGRDNKEYTPIVIHRAIISTLERFISYLIEKNKGILPLWITPVQVILIPVHNQIHLSYAKKIKDLLVKNNFRVELNDKDFSLGYKIRQAQKNKIPYQIVIGDKEMNNETLTFRKYQSTKRETLRNEEFIQMLNKIILGKK
ncbi:threonine--tRNA ligase [Columbia Basin potato purple top phytoplasma]|uniref:Threonine--tRNA ligase n=1 Tax=Columbia Basin potato purple top phytoplasma TaxID=307134 RepID=A0ABT5L899_9MOLU|nr:threonine--tRNA ligase [Columbia Basin potato purple top phytoplasma]MDC9031900.1 threonine--tRNA ligase [Columbia Basin potato purple top phytoplasma]